MEKSWTEPDHGIWEMRGPRRHFTHSKVMAWVALDRAAKAVTQFGLPGPADRWRAVADAIHAEVCREGFDAEAATASCSTTAARRLDGALLMLPLVGFLPPDDPRIVGTVKAIQQRLCVDGLVRRYVPDDELDGMPGGEGVFLACSFWLVDNLALMGRGEEATALFERLLGFCNDLGLIAEEYDPANRRHARQLPAGLLAHLAGQLGAQPRHRARPGAGAGGRRAEPRSERQRGPHLRKHSRLT